MLGVTNEPNNSMKFPISAGKRKLALIYSVVIASVISFITSQSTTLLVNALIPTLHTTKGRRTLNQKMNDNRSDGWSIKLGKNENHCRTVLMNNNDDNIYHYEHDGWNLTYRFKEADYDDDDAPSLLLIHPVGIGLSSWFWKRFLNVWKGSSAVYAPDLIGCGMENGGDIWDPNQRGIFFPLTWAKACEELMMQQNSKGGKSKKFVVITNGALARLGVTIAARNPSLVSKLILCSPPSYEDMIKSVPQADIGRNMGFLMSPLGNIAFDALEQRFFIRLFSNLFLFSDNEGCDDEWLQEIADALSFYSTDRVMSRAAVVAFNAGALEHRSYQEDLEEKIEQPTLILIGEEDKRGGEVLYKKAMKDCNVRQLVGKNVLPYESVKDFSNAIKDFL